MTPLVRFDCGNPPKAFVHLREVTTDTTDVLRRLTKVLEQVSSVDTDALRDTADLLRFRAAEFDACALTFDRLRSTGVTALNNDTNEETEVRP